MQNRPHSREAEGETCSIASRQWLCILEFSNVKQDSGIVGVGDLARQFKLGAELMHSTIATRLGTAIDGRLESGILYTALHISKIKSQVD